MINLYFQDNSVGTIPYLYILTRNPFKAPKRVNTRISLANSDGDKLVRSQYGNRDILIEGVISAPTRDLMEVSRDLLLQYLDYTEGRLEFTVAGALRRFYATVENEVFSENAKGGKFGFSIKMTASDPFAYDANSTSLSGLSGAISTATSNKTVTFAGSAKQRPVITATVTTVTGGTGQSLTLTNPDTGEAITINRTWANGDVAIVDFMQRTVTVNGVATDYTGQFSEWRPGSRTVAYSDTFTTRSVTLSGNYVKRYL